jgi:Glyoxalase superfamily protein
MNFPDAKNMAAILRKELGLKHIDLGHSACLELVAKQHGYHDWNTMAAAQAKPETGSGLLPLPKGWEVIGRRARVWFDIGVDKGAGRSGQNALVIRTRSPSTEVDDVNVWATFKQMFSARQWIGRRVKFSCFVRCEDIGDAGYPFLRIDNALGQKLAYVGWWEVPGQNFSGTTDWRACSMVVTVPEKASSIEFGASLTGCSGKLQMCDIAFGETDEPETLIRAVEGDEPRNLALA